MAELKDEIRAYWDEDAATYDQAPQHRPRSAAVQAAWTATLARLLPPVPARVLDCGAGTGFLSLTAARIGHRVTALDVSTAMLSVLRRSARAEGLDIEVVEGPADQPAGAFDAVMERHLLWTLPDPAGALAAWHDVALTGRLVLVESLWGSVDPIERWRSAARRQLHRLRGGAPEHHAEYPAEIRASLPLGRGTRPERLVEMARTAGWSTPRLERLGDVEWAERLDLPFPERLVGPTPRFAVVAGS